jgi:NADH dehydrogenase
MKAKIDDILCYQYSTHPQLAAKPSDNILVNAAKDALTKFKESAGKDCPAKG